MKYKKGDKFYKEDKARNRLNKIEIENIVYVLKGGLINGKKYVTDEDIKKAVDRGDIYLTNEVYRQKKIDEKKQQLEQLQKEIEKLENVA